jgi:hypothetical protein
MAKPDITIRLVRMSDVPGALNYRQHVPGVGMLGVPRKWLHDMLTANPWLIEENPVMVAALAACATEADDVTQPDESRDELRQAVKDVFEHWRPT